MFQMSAYIVSHETINRIVSFLYSNTGISAFSRNETIAKAGFPIAEQEGCSKLGKAMLKLNVAAVDQRYNEKNRKEVIVNYQFNKVATSRIQALKSLQCLLYQCSEGNVPKRKQYKMLKAIEKNIMHEIIDSLPEYQKAEWG